MSEPVINRLHRYLSTRIEVSQSTIASFSDRLADSPIDAFDAADSAMEAAAVLAVCEGLRHMLVLLAEKGHSDDEIRQLLVAHAQRDALRHARFPSKTSSASANIMKVNVAAACADLADALAWS